MTKSIRTLLAFSAIAISGAALPALAGDLEPVRVNVPFAFTAGKANLPAGEYTVYEDESRMIMIRGQHGGVFVLGMSGPENLTDKTSLSFDHNEKGYFLKGVHEYGKTSVRVAPPAVPNER